MKQTNQALPLPYADMGDDIAMVALGGVSLLPQNIRPYKQKTLSTNEPKLNESAIAVCKQMGINQDDYKETMLEGKPNKTLEITAQLTTQLSTMQVDICEKLGIDQVDYLKTLNEK